MEILSAAWSYELDNLRTTKLRARVLQDGRKLAGIVNGRAILNETAGADEVVLHVETIARVVC